MATKKKFSPAQLAAQKLFAERARAGKLKKNPGLYANINAKKKRIAAGSCEKMRKPGEPGRPTAQAFIDSAKTAKRNPDKAKPRAYVRRVSQATGTAPSKRLIARRKIALTAPAGYFPNPKKMSIEQLYAELIPKKDLITGYQVICMHPKKHVVGVFKTMAQAKQIAVAMANLNNVTYAVKAVKVHKTHFAV